jgi:hypothetical protein
MALTPDLPARVVFGPFEVNASTGELRRNGIPVRLPGQSYEILRLLLASRGELVTREQISVHRHSERPVLECISNPCRECRTGFNSQLHSTAGQKLALVDSGGSLGLYPFVHHRLETKPSEGYAVLDG